MIRQFKVDQRFHTVSENSEYYGSISIQEITISRKGTTYLFSNGDRLSEKEINEKIDSDRMFLAEADAIRKNILNLKCEAKRYNQNMRKKILDKENDIKKLTLEKK